MAVSRDVRVHVDHAVRGCGLALLRLALHAHALRRLCAVVSRPLLAGAVAAALRRLVLGGHAAPPLFCQLVAVAVAQPLLARQLPVPQRRCRVRPSRCRRAAAVEARRRVAGGVGDNNARKATSHGVRGCRLARYWRRLEHLQSRRRQLRWHYSCAVVGHLECKARRAARGSGSSRVGRRHNVRAAPNLRRRVPQPSTRGHESAT